VGIINKLKSISKIQILAVVLILIGLVAMVRYGIGTFNAYREIQYARANNFGAGNVDPNILRPWMSMRYIAVAYAVPQEYLFHELGIPMERRNSEVSLFDLNDQFHFGPTTQGDKRYPAILDKVRDAIIKYRENPVPTGLREGGVRPWMSIQYVANSTGIPAETIFAQIGVPADGNAYIPLEFLVDAIKYKGGLRGLTDAVQRVVDANGASQ